MLCGFILYYGICSDFLFVDLRGNHPIAGIDYALRDGLWGLR